jgi:hypothetical protein
VTKSAICRLADGCSIGDGDPRRMLSASKRSSWTGLHMENWMQRASNDALFDPNKNPALYGI